jgi:hypothetical protein
MTAFKGSIGKFLPLPSPEQIIYEDYLDWREKEDTTVKDTEEPDVNNKVTFSF